MPDKLTVGSCFSGIGGLELGLEWTGGFETKWQVEIDPYATKVLEKHWPKVQRFSDITTVSNPPRVDVICGGFPCQDVSLAGARKGLDGNRSTLWSEMFRLVCEIRPQWFVGENVPGLLSANDGRFFGKILRDLASIGFDAEWGMLSASGVGARHLRRRVFVLAYPDKKGLEGDFSARFFGRQPGLPTERRQVVHATIAGLPDWSGGEVGQPAPLTEPKRSSRREIERDFCGVAHGVSSRVDRLKCLGNAVVPQVAQKVGEVILRYEAAKEKEEISVADSNHSEREKRG